MSKASLCQFIESLCKDGEITVDKDLSSFDDEDLSNATNLLREIYDIYKLYLPKVASPFLESAALWPAKYLYRITQCILMRDLEEEKVKELLEPYEKEKTAEAIYSVDLLMRYLPDFFNLAKGLAPDDS